LVRAVIGTLNSLLQAVQTPIAGAVESHLVTRRLRFAILFGRFPQAIKAASRISSPSIKLLRGVNDGLPARPACCTRQHTAMAALLPWIGLARPDWYNVMLGGRHAESGPNPAELKALDQFFSGKASKKSMFACSSCSSLRPFFACDAPQADLPVLIPPACAKLVFG
jgi:hypothetical protein